MRAAVKENTLINSGAEIPVIREELMHEDGADVKVNSTMCGYTGDVPYSQSRRKLRPA